MTKADRLTLGVAMYAAVVATVLGGWQVVSLQREMPRLEVSIDADVIGIPFQDSAATWLTAVLVNSGFKPVAVTRARATLTVDTGVVRRAVAVFDLTPEGIPLRVEAQEVVSVPLNTHAGRYVSELRRLPRPTDNRPELAYLTVGNFPAVLELTLFTSTGAQVTLLHRLELTTADMWGVGGVDSVYVDPYPNVNW